MALQVIPSGGGTANADGILIPQADLAGYGVTDSEMTNDETGLARAVWGFLKAVQDYDLSSALGVSKPASVNPIQTGLGELNRTYSFTTQKYVNVKNGNSGVVPLPTSGANNGVGGVAIADIFSTASKVSASGAIGASGIVIPTADLTAIDESIVHGSLDVSAGQDNRNVINAIYEAFSEVIPTRDASTASAFTNSTRGTLGLIATIPATYIQATDPVSDLDPTDAGNGQIALLSKTATITIQTVEDLTNDTIDVNVVTS